MNNQAFAINPAASQTLIVRAMHQPFEHTPGKWLWHHTGVASEDHWIVGWHGDNCDSMADYCPHSLRDGFVHSHHGDVVRFQRIGELWYWVIERMVTA